MVKAKSLQAASSLKPSPQLTGMRFIENVLPVCLNERFDNTDTKLFSGSAVLRTERVA